MRELTPGHMFAGYEIQCRLGAGGMGAVYLARDSKFPRSIALKLLDSADDQSRKRFLSEAEHIARLDHPNIVAVYDRGSEDGQLWISMQYIDGGDAATAVRTRGVLPADRAVRIISEAAKGLDFAHAQGVLHRDVKPANILLGQPTGGQEERVVVADFGIAKALEDTQGLTGKGMPPATLAYAAPERFTTSTAVDARADVYSLGCTLYYLITGSLPYSGTAPQLMRAHCEEPIPQPSRVPAARDAGLPSAFDSVIEQALAKDPNDRPPSCRALAEAARQALASAAPALATDATGTGSVPPVTRPTWARHTRKPVPTLSSQPSTPPPDTVADQPADHTSTSTNRTDGFSTRCRQLVAAARQALRSRPATPLWRRRSTAAAIAVILLVLGVGVTVKNTIWPRPESEGVEKTLTIARPGDTDELAFSGTAGQKVFVEVASTTLPSGYFLSLRDPVGKEIAQGYIGSSGSGFIDTTALPASGDYAVVLGNSSSNATGEAAVRVIDVVDQDATISPDGTAVTSKIDTPGAVSRFRFAGTAGQKVFVEVASSTLPSGYSLSLRDPVGKEIANGYIHSDGSGSIDTTALPVDGDYTLIIDPTYTDRITNGTGKSQVRVFTVVDQNATISPDGTPVTSKIDTPGAVSRFRFHGTAGQKVSVEVALSTLLSSSYLSLRDPVGKEIAYGYIHTDGSGSIATTALPVDGEYTLVIAPEYTDRIRNGTGESQVRLYTR